MGPLRLAGERAEVQIKGVRGACRLKAAYRTRTGGARLLVLGPPVHHAHAGGIPQHPEAHALQAGDQLRVVVCGLADLARIGCACIVRSTNQSTMPSLRHTFTQSDIVVAP